MFEYYTNLHFKQVADMAEANIKIQIVSGGCEDGRSMVGKPSILSTKSYTMWLRTDATERTILHEFCHALGLLHEHQSPRRPFSIRSEGLCHSVAIQPDFNNTVLIGQSDLVKHNTCRRHRYEIGICTSYDPQSIMQ